MASTNSYQHIFNAQQSNVLTQGSTSYKVRITLLNTLKKAVEVTFRQAILKALKSDLNKPEVESELTEIHQIITEIKFVKRHLKQWMAVQNVPTPLAMLGSSSYYKYESKGVCLIISPWNFPFNLTLSPLISAIAAGNCVIIKPSEFTPNASAVMAKIVAHCFSENHVALIQGDAATASELLKLPFHHIFFTGSLQVGKLVMQAAANHLSSITLELGGKSPTIITKSANLKQAAKKVVWGKFLNCGQICIAPDYVLVHQSIKAQFITYCNYWIYAFFGDDPKTASAYGRIVNTKHFNRLKAYLTDLENDADVEIHGGKTDVTTNYISPTLVTNLPENTTLLTEEIFGPILPVKPFNNLTEAVNYINQKPRPLALYIYSKNQSSINYITKHTRAGGTCINTNILQYANPHLPFGGVNFSGIGKSHGFFGFKAFSNTRAFVKQHTFGVAELLFPPYTSFKEKLARITVKWF